MLHQAGSRGGEGWNDCRGQVSLGVNLLGRFLETPTKIQWIALNHLLEFLRATKNMYLELKGERVGDKDDRKSTSGHVVFYRDSPVNWSAKKQKCVASSTLESEYVSLADAAREAFYTKKLAESIEAIQVNATLFCDNIAAQTVAEGRSGSTTKGAKHIEIKYHLGKDLNMNGDITVKRVRSDLNCADLFTKPLPIQLFKKHSQDVHRLRVSND